MKRSMWTGARCVLIGMLLPIGFASAEVKLPQVIGDNMVLQQGKTVNIWGWAGPGEEVTVSFGNEKAAVKAGGDGKWLVRLKEQKASSTPQEMKVSGADNELVVKNILVGEVWLCSGQSNMQWGMNRTEKATEEIPESDYPMIRLCQIRQRCLPVPADDLPAKWAACSPGTVKGFSAVGYHFGKNLHKELDVPVGLVQSAWGATEIEPWTPIEGFRKVQSLQKYAAAVSALTKQSKIRNTTPSAIYNGMIHPLRPMTMRGAIWYQGESNCLKGDTDIYADKTKALVEGWREVFGQKDLSFYFVQIAPFTYKKTFLKKNASLTTESLPRFWEAQTACLDTIPNCGMVVVTDITGNVGNIHPGNKRDVGYRLALWAMAKNYGEKDRVHSGPRYEAMQVKGNKAALSFAHAGSGLRSLDGKELAQFAIAGEDKVFAPAKAEIVNDTVVVSSPDIEKPAAVRFAWHETAVGNLGNKEGLPAIPFRTDAW